MQPHEQLYWCSWYKKKSHANVLDKYKDYCDSQLKKNQIHHFYREFTKTFPYPIGRQSSSGFPYFITLLIFPAKKPTIGRYPRNAFLQEKLVVVKSGQTRELRFQSNNKKATMHRTSEGKKLSQQKHH